MSLDSRCSQESELSLWDIEFIQIKEEYIGKLFFFHKQKDAHLLLSIEKAYIGDNESDEGYKFTLLGKGGIWVYYEFHPVCLGEFI